MQPDDIIQQKEWHELTTEEKKILQTLVSDEQEFNILKKMMMIADETATDVPQVNPSVQQQLHRSIKKSNQKWYYAAAAILLITASAWFLLRNEKDNRSPIVTNPQPGEIIKKDGSTPKDSIVPQKEIILPKTDTTHTAPAQKTEIPVAPPGPSSEKLETSYASISTLLKDDSSLMAFVTEVY